MSLVEVKVPDIGDFKDVDVIEVNIKPGDAIENEQALLTLESDKASIEVPSDTAGTVKEVRVKTGDKVSQGTIIAIVESSAKPPPPRPPKSLRKRPLKRMPSPRRRPLRRRSSRPLRLKRVVSPVTPISNAIWSCSVPGLVATLLLSALLISG